MFRSAGRKRALASLAIVAAGALLLAGCAGGGASGDSAGGDDGTPVKGGNLNVRIPQDPGSLDTVASGNVGTTYISREIFEQLVTLDEKFEIKPVLATKWEKSEDGLTYTFEVRDDVVFSDGTPMTEKDVAASLNDWATNGGYADSLNRVLDSITAPDTSKVVIKLTQPMDVVALMAYSTGSQIHKADLVENKPAKGIPNDQVIGTGPYKLKKWTPGEEIVLERNDKYSPPQGEASGYAGKRGAYLDTITWKIIGDDDAAFNAFKSGQLHVNALSSNQYELAQNDNTMKVGIQASGSIIHMATNQNPESIMSNPKARDAINLVLDKEAVIAAQGAPELNLPTNGAFAAKDSNLYSEAGKKKWNEHNPEKAKKLFEEAGYKPGQKIKLLTTDEFPMFKDSLVQLQQDLKAIGVESEINAYDFGTMIGMCQNDPDKWDILGLMDDSFPPVPNYTDNVVDLGCAGYNRDALTPYITAFGLAQTPEQHKKAVDDIQAFTSENLPTIPLYDMRTAIGYTPKLKGYKGWALEFSNAWLAK